MQNRPIRLAIILPIDAEYTHRLLEGVADYLEANKDIEIVEIPYLMGTPPALPAGNHEIQGVLTHLALGDTWVRQLLDAGLPVVNTSGEWWGLGPNAVAFSGKDMLNQIVDYAITLDRKHIGYIWNPTSAGMSRAKTVERFMEEVTIRGATGSTHEIINSHEGSIRLSKPDDLATEQLRAYLVGLPGPAVAFCADDYIARVVCNEAISAGLRIPDDLAVIGVGDYAVARLGNPPITTMPQPGKLIGSRAIEFLHHIIDGTEKAGHVAVPSPPLLLRESTRGSLRTDQRMQRVREWIHQHACEGLTVSELTEMVPMSQTTFAKLFERSFGRTPGEEIREVKMKKAMEYLRGTSFSVETISHLCGFEQQGKFSKFFKRQTGMTPSEYRAGIRAEARGESKNSE